MGAIRPGDTHVVLPVAGLVALLKEKGALAGVVVPDAGAPGAGL